VNLDQITRDIEALTESYPFEIPGYFALILRCFSVLGAPPAQLSCTDTATQVSAARLLPLVCSAWGSTPAQVRKSSGSCCRGDSA
jgi:hypothetical protein